MPGMKDKRPADPHPPLHAHLSGSHTQLHSCTLHLWGRGQGQGWVWTGWVPGLPRAWLSGSAAAAGRPPSGMRGPHQPPPPPTLTDWARDLGAGLNPRGTPESNEWGRRRPSARKRGARRGNTEEKMERLRQRRVKPGAWSVRAGGSGILGTLGLRLERRARGRAGKSRGREAAGSQGRAEEAGGPDARVLQTAPSPARDCELGRWP